MKKRVTLKYQTLEDWAESYGRNACGALVELADILRPNASKILSKSRALTEAGESGYLLVEKGGKTQLVPPIVARVLDEED